MPRDTDPEPNERTGSNSDRSVTSNFGTASRRAFLRTGAFGISPLIAGRSRANSATTDGAAQEESEPGEGQVREFTVHAVHVDIVYNVRGDEQDNGVMYVLEENLEAALEASDEVPGESEVDTSVLEPLTIRANVGDIIEITFVNDLDTEASMHQYGLPFEVETSDGMAVGYNGDTTVPPEGSTTYRWYATHRGTFFFGDAASPAILSDPEGKHDDNNLHTRGLFGAVVVEPEGATWTDPRTGEPLTSGVRADVHVPNGIDHREFLAFYHDAVDVKNRLQYPTGRRDEFAIHAINYRGEHLDGRINDDCPDCDEHERFYSSWVHGDPGGGDTVFKAYAGDPVKFVAVGAQLEETHVHHLHGHRWKKIAGEPESDTIDAQAIGPGAAYETLLVFGHGEFTTRPELTWSEAFSIGAGYRNGIGDYLFHCHMFPHYGEGMNGIMRVLRKERDDLVPLPNNDPEIPAGSDVPGFPEFVPGAFGESPPRPPSPKRRPETRREEAMLGDTVPGAPYTDPCPADAPVREYTIVALAANIVYNDAGEHDPDGIVFALEEDAAAIRSGEMNPEPLIIRARVGECIDVTLKNELSSEVSNHIHFVGYDPLGSDATEVGFNYNESAPPGGEAHYRWHADERGMIFFHDHMTGISRGMNGPFAALIVEPSDTEWFDPYSGEPIEAGAQAMVRNPDGEDYRELAILYHDFAQLRDPDTGEFVNDLFEHNVNAGAHAINYRNAPYYNRDTADPAYVHSSKAHGDPPTPVMEFYEGDRLKIHLIQGAYEEQHNFVFHGLKNERVGVRQVDADAQRVGVSETYTFEITDHVTMEDVDIRATPNPDDRRVRDYLYGSMPISDVWGGMWGIARGWDAEVEHLQPLPSRDAPEDYVTVRELREMGHPAPDDRRAEFGQKALLTWGISTDDRTVPPDHDARHNEAIGTLPEQVTRTLEMAEDDRPVREYDVTAFQVEIPYNRYGDHDPHGIVFALDEHVEEIREGERPVQPLVLRANLNERIRINLTNELPESLDAEHEHGRVDIDRPWDPSSRVSLHTKNFVYNVERSDGATVGFNSDQTIAPGETITYSWVAHEEGAAVMWDMADLRSHRHHGAFGMCLAEPEGSEWLDARTGEPTATATEAIIVQDDGTSYREFPLQFTEAMYVVNDDEDRGAVIPEDALLAEEAAELGTAEGGAEVGAADGAAEDAEGAGADPAEADDRGANRIGDPEDQGFPGINYRSAPFSRRFENDDRQHKVYSSVVHGDPDTPIPRAVTGDPVQFAVGEPADKANGISFHLSGHQWRRNGTPEEAIVGVQDDLTTGRAYALDLVYGAGGPLDSPGDYVYQETKNRYYLEGGLWGIFRVRDALEAFDDPIQPLPHRASTTPSERPGWKVAATEVDDEIVVAVGVPRSDRLATNAGAVYLFYGADGSDPSLTLADADAALLGAVGGERAGASLQFGIDEREGAWQLVVGTRQDASYTVSGEERPTGTSRLEHDEGEAEPEAEE